jgi:hypothetical protein
MTETGRCDYHERNRDCRETPIFAARIEGRDLLLCERHARPEFWPPDLRPRLPGRLQRLKAAFTQQWGDRA